MQRRYANMISWLAVFINLIVLITVYKKDLSFSLILLGFFIAVILDMFDGSVARKYNDTKESKVMGELTDSLCDIINFGALPVITYIVKFSEQSIPVLVIMSFLFLWAGIFRLARFSSQKVEGAYIGMPITIGGLLFVIGQIFFTNPMFLNIWCLLIIYAMVSKIRIKKLKI